MYFYNIFNRVFSTNNELPIRLCSAKQTDAITGKIIFVSRDNVFKRYSSKKKQLGRSLYQIEIGYLIIKDNIQFIIDKSARFILIYCDGNSDKALIYLLGEVLSLFLRLKSEYQIHACMLNKDVTTIVLCGSSGSGKTTLANEFLNKGWNMLCDDHSIIYEKTNSFWGVPSFPYYKIFQKEIDIDNSNVCVTINDTGKVLVGVKKNNINSVYTRDYPITCIYFLDFQVDGKDQIRLEKLNSEDLLRNLIKNSYGNLRSNGDTFLLFKDIEFLSMLNRISKSVHGYKLSFSKVSSPCNVAEHIIEQVKEK